ncbi:18S rRNA maturation protein [Puccinia graminis f. sp. tritici]|uniref:rRNA-processing protein EFG1 n=1 Tax=Puccinia graminis f. sp. tritici TaxID=56615 RepID=A0A5B0LR94_PUCGR|nr:18S rRNA maturation protein [Puccinia graminis f. sp. tritici]KAA1083900.1 18S rRNA maturation protein [Puccinia graminis f. sp. tritici]
MAKKGAQNSKRTSSALNVSDGPALGISKLKSQLRQAKRLLLKDGLSPELRSTTENRIEQLQASMEHVPSKEQERRNAIKYHRIKFFDRKKVDRRLKKVLTQLDQLNSTKNPKKSQQQKLELEAQHLRIDLNYIRHYPKHLKYVSLCPGGEYKDHETTTTSSLPDATPSSKEPDALRSYVRILIHQSMESGTLSKTPDTDDQNVTEEADELERSNVAAEDDEFFEHDGD